MRPLYSKNIAMEDVATDFMMTCIKPGYFLDFELLKQKFMVSFTSMLDALKEVLRREIQGLKV
jgi:hypothetical protein